MTQTPQFKDRPLGKVLVGVKSCHALVHRQL
jgi:hypothetical protein